MNDNSLSFVGLGKLGLPLATCLAESGKLVLGLDSDINKIHKLQKGIAPFYEAIPTRYSNESRLSPYPP